MQFHYGMLDVTFRYFKVFTKTLASVLIYGFYVFFAELDVILKPKSTAYPSYVTLISTPDMGFPVAYVTGGTTNSIALRLIHVEPSRSTLYRFLPNVSLGIIQDVQQAFRHLVLVRQ